MATITEDYVSFDTAKLLKEKGFDARCPMIYTADGEMLYTDVKHHNMYAVTNKQLEYYTDIIAPTLQMAMKWLRLIYHIHIRLVDSTDESYRYEIYPRKGKYNSVCFTDNCYYETREEACEVAIKYCLENLI